MDCVLLRVEQKRDEATQIQYFVYETCRPMQECTLEDYNVYKNGVNSVDDYDYRRERCLRSIHVRCRSIKQFAYEDYHGDCCCKVKI